KEDHERAEGGRSGRDIEEDVASDGAERLLCEVRLSSSSRPRRQDDLWSAIDEPVERIFEQDPVRDQAQVRGRVEQRPVREEREPLLSRWVCELGGGGDDMALGRARQL